MTRNDSTNLFGDTPSSPSDEFYGTLCSVMTADSLNTFPSITITLDEWNSLHMLKDCIQEYFKLCSQCEQPAYKLLSKYVQFFTNQYKHMALAAAYDKQDSARRRVKTDLSELLPIALRESQPLEALCTTTCPFERLVDAEVRVFCGDKVSSLVSAELAKDFTYLL